jgi:hypothetical protein
MDVNSAKIYSCNSFILSQKGLTNESANPFKEIDTLELTT